MKKMLVAEDDLLSQNFSAVFRNSSLRQTKLTISISD